MSFLADGTPLSEAGEGSNRSEVPFEIVLLGKMQMKTGLFVVF